MRASTWWRRAVAWLTRNRLDDQLAEEISDHLERRRQQLIAAGMEPDDAAREARRSFGNITAIRERSRDQWGSAALSAFVQDVRFGARMMTRNPGLCAVVVLTSVSSLGRGREGG